jgi:hypothetical protein
LVEAQLTAITELLEVQNQNRLPLPEPGVFSGNPLQYPKSFETLIEKAEQLTRPKDYIFLGNMSAVKPKKW